jgi:hypothetical protein
MTKKGRHKLHTSIAVTDIHTSAKNPQVSNITQGKTVGDYLYPLVGKLRTASNPIRQLLQRIPRAGYSPDTDSPLIFRIGVAHDQLVVLGVDLSSLSDAEFFNGRIEVTTDFKPSTIVAESMCQALLDARGKSQWGEQMVGYQSIRQIVRGNPERYSRYAPLFKGGNRTQRLQVAKYPPKQLCFPDVGHIPPEYPLHVVAECQIPHDSGLLAWLERHPRGGGDTRVSKGEKTKHQGLRRYSD